MSNELKSKRALASRSRQYKAPFLYEALVVIFAGKGSVSEYDANDRLNLAAIEGSWSKNDAGRIMAYLLDRKFILPQGQNFLLVQRRFKSLGSHVKKNDIKSDSKQPVEIQKMYRNQKKQIRLRAAKVAFNEGVVFILKSIFEGHIATEFSLDSFQKWVSDYMHLEWSHTQLRKKQEKITEFHNVRKEEIRTHKKRKKRTKFCVDIKDKEPALKKAVIFFNKMKKCGLIFEKTVEKKTLSGTKTEKVICLSEKGAIYCGLKEDGVEMSKLSKPEKCRKVLELLHEQGIDAEGINANGLQRLKKQVRQRIENATSCCV